MAVSGKLYSSFHTKLANKEIDLDSDVIKVALCTSSYTPNQNAHDYFDDITNEVSGSGYTAGGATLGSKSVGTGGGKTFTFDADDVTWSSSTITARYAIIYDSTGTASTSPLIGYIDFGADVSSSSSNFTIQWNASGIFTQTVA